MIDDEAFGAPVITIDEPDGTPMANVMVRTAGKPSGIAATDKPTTTMNISSKG